MTDIPYTTSLITPQWRIEEALRERLAELGGAVEFGTQLTGFTQSQHAVSATVTSGTQAETLQSEWLVGCDGGRSLVRKRAGIAFQGETHDDIQMLVADVHVAGLDRQAWHMWRDADGTVSLCPLPSTDTFQFQASISPGQDAQPDLATMQRLLTHRSGRGDIVLAKPQWSSLWRANIRLAESYREGQIFLAGDAAHVHSPAGGQGMNTGIQDAHNLGWKLSAVARGDAAPGLLNSYAAERRPVAAHVLTLSNARLASAIQDNGISTTRDEHTIQLDVNYRSSWLSWDDRDDTARLRAGDRAPDATGLRQVGGHDVRLFDLTRGPGWTLLAFGDTPARVPTDLEVRTLHVVDTPAAKNEVADTHGHLAHTYGAGDHTLVLIRPDGYIGLICDAGTSAIVTGYLAELHQIRA